MTKLSKEYDTTIKYPISYQNLPNDKLLQEDPLSEIDVHIKATGFKLISAEIFPKNLLIDASNIYSKSINDYYLLLSQQRLSLQKQMRTGVQIDHFINDSIKFNLGLLKVKKVPVKVATDITYSSGYELNGVLQVSPDSITINGPEFILDTIHFVSTTLLQKKGINNSIDQELMIKNFDASSNVKFNQKKVAVKALVEKYTEGTFEVPFEIVNLPEGMTINTFPKLVKITFRVALSNFNKVDASSFVIECNYKMSNENSLSYLIPRLVEKSSLVKNTKISPLKIDYIINK
ncbi:MAG: CdaR family protein [Flavobacteriaceae bacterium]